MATVFMLGGAFSGLNNYMPQQLGGRITNGNEAIQVPYNNFGLFLSTVQQGAQLLDAYLKAGSGPMIAFGHSLGAVVCNYWLKAYAPDTAIDPADLSFVWIGNSVSKYGGALGPNGKAEWQNWFTDITAPDDTAFVCADVKQVHEGWTDWPEGTMNLDAEFNALAGQSVLHPHYEKVNPDPNAAGNVSHIEGNITYIWAQTYPMPMFGTTTNSVVAQLDAQTRPTVESAYNRPVVLPSPTQ